MSSKRNDATSRRSHLGSKQSPVRKHTRFAFVSDVKPSCRNRRWSLIRRFLAKNSSLGHRHYARHLSQRQLSCPLVLVRMDLSCIPSARNALSVLRRSRLPDRTPTDTAINGACVSSRFSKDDDTEECEPPSIPPLQLALSNSSWAPSIGRAYCRSAFPLTVPHRDTTRTKSRFRVIVALEAVKSVGIPI